MPKLTKKTISIYVLALIALYIVIAVIPGLTGVLKRTEVIEYGKMRISDDVTFHIVRDETVYTSEASGTTNHLVKEGMLIKKGTSIMSVVAGDDDKKEDAKKSKFKAMLSRLGDGAVPAGDYASQRKGVVSYFVDGYESLFTVAQVKNITFEKAEKASDSPINVNKKTIIKGDPAFKICDNSKWYLLAWIKKESIPKYEVGKEVTIELPKAEVKGMIEDIKADKDQWLVVIGTNRYYKDFAKARKVKGSVRTIDTNGLIISNSCLTTSNKQVGVYVKDTTGEYVFTPVKVVVSDGEKSMVLEGTYFDEKGKAVNTVKVYDEVLKKPGAEKK